MDLLYTHSKEWPYAENSPKDSVGQWLGTLPLNRIGHVSCWDAVRDARREFTELLMGKIRQYLEDNHEMVQDSGNIIDFSLFMVGRSSTRTKPTIMFVSEDKRARKQAFKMVKASDIMKEHPGFELAHIPLTAEFENLRFLAGKDADLTCDAFPPSEPLDVFTPEVGKLEGRRLYFYGTSEPQTTPRTATAGGVISYQGKRMILTVDHFLEPTQSAAPSIVPHSEDDEDDDDDCEITGFSDIDDESDNDLVDVTSQCSATPESVALDMDGSESGGHGASLLSSGSTVDGQEYMAAVQARLERFDLTQGRVTHIGGPKDACIRAGNVVQRSKELDYALIEVDPAVGKLCDVGHNIIDLDDESLVEKNPRDAAIKTTTPGGGTVGGILSGTPSLVRFPHSKTYTEVYVARFDQPLVEGDCGSWVRDAVTGNLFGHVFAGSPTSGLTMVMPACGVFEKVRSCVQNRLDSFEAKLVGIAEGNAERHEGENEQLRTPNSQTEFRADVLLGPPLGFPRDEWAVNKERDSWQASVLKTKTTLPELHPEDNAELWCHEDLNDDKKELLDRKIPPSIVINPRDRDDVDAMAEAVGLASGVLTFASFAFKSSVALYNTFQGFHTYSKRVRDLLAELKALSEMLRLLTETINATPDVDLSALELPLRRCGDACKEFGQELLRCSSRSGGDRTSFRDWAKLQYLGDGIDDFTQLLAGYKSTINIALADAHLRRSATTAEGLEKYQTMIKTTTDDLKARLNSIDAKLAAVFERTVNETDSDARELQRIRAERASTQKCLEICAQLADHINRIQHRPSPGLSTPTSVDAEAYPDRVTNEGLQACKERLAQTVASLEKHMQQLVDRLIEKSAAKMNSEHEVAQLATLREEWTTARQCLDICSSAESHVKENISIIDNYATGDDTVQFLVSTNGKTIHGKNRGYSSITRQVGGYLSDASVQQMSRDISRISLQVTRKEGASPQDGAFSATDDLVVQDGPNADFKERYGQGVRLSETLDIEATHMSDVDGKLSNVAMHLMH